MANRRIIAIFIIVFVGISLIIAIPILTLSSSLSNYGTIDRSLPFEYVPDSSSPIEKLSINADVGNIEIKYIDPPVNYVAKLDVNIKMNGEGIAGKSYLDYFSVDWENTSTIPTFTIELKSELENMEVLSLIKNITIVVYLRADIVFDINVTVSDGNINLRVPFGVTINNVSFNVTLGNILYNFHHCTLEGNITGIADDGDIELIAYNPEYTRNTIWTYRSNTGDITISIIHDDQNKIMNANITGSLVGNENGDITVNYDDNTANIGARITLNDTVQGLRNYGSDWEGFENEVLKNSTGDPFGYELTSTDYPTITNYNLLVVGLTLHGYDGKYEVHLFSS